MNGSTKAQEEIAVFEHSFEQIQQEFHLENDAKKIKAYLFEHDLADFLVWVQQPIIDVFGEIRMELQLLPREDSNEIVLALNVQPNFMEEDEIMDLHDMFFKLLEHYHAIDNILKYMDFDLWGFNHPNYVSY